MAFKKTVGLCILGLLIVLPANLQAQKRKIQKADEAFDAGEYFEAIDLYRDAYSAVRDREVKQDLMYQIAETYRITNDPKHAETWYRKFLKKGQNRPEAYLRLAESYKMQGEYENALNEYKRYKQLVPNDPRADQGIRSCELALEWMENPESFVVEELDDLNSRQSDFSPSFAREDYQAVYFTSSRDDAEGNKSHGATGENFTDIFESRLDRKGKWSTPVPVAALNSEFEDGSTTFTSDYNEVFFTRCEANKRRALGCKIMHAEWDGQEWSDPEDTKILGDSLVAAHPSVSPDGRTLYFVSDMPGGMGGKDIYRVRRGSAGSAWSQPENLGPDINTPGNEVFPFIHPDGNLYFASNGHLTMGGLDIFKGIPQADGSWVVSNLKYPINSMADDFSIVIQPDEMKGIFASTRKGKGNDELYSFVLPPLRFNISGTVKDEKTENVLGNATVRLIGSDGTNIQTQTAGDGSFRFILQPTTDYILLASLQGYLNGKERETTKGQEKSNDFSTTIYMTSIEKPIELPNILYDFGKWDLRPESMVSLDKLVETLNDNPNVTIELMSHTDSRDTEEYNEELSQKRAQAVVDYLISKGIEGARLSAQGYGESEPKVVDEKIVAEYNFLQVGQTLTEAFIDKLPSVELQEIAHQINRRTEFRVLSTDYKIEQN